MTNAWYLALRENEKASVWEAYYEYLSKGETFPPNVGQIASQSRKTIFPEVVEIGFSSAIKFRESEPATQHYWISMMEEKKDVRRMYVCKRTKFKSGESSIETSTGLVRNYID